MPAPSTVPATDLLSQLIDGMNTAAGSMTGALIPAGTSLMATLLAAVIAYQGLMMMLQYTSAMEVVASFIHKSIFFSIAVLLFDNYETLFGVHGALMQTFDSISGQLNNGLIFRNQLSNVGVKVIETIMALFNDPPEKTSAADSGFWDSLTQAFDTIKVLPLITGLVAFIFKLVAAFFMIIAGVVLLGQMILANIMITLGAALGPVLIPWIVWEPAAFLFSGWIRFMIIAGMWQVVGSAMFTIVQGVFTKSATMMSTAVASGELMTIYSVGSAIILMAMISAYLMMKIPDLAQAIIGGGGAEGLSMRSFHPASAAAGKGWGAAKATAGGSKAAAGSTYRSAFNGYAAGNRGFNAGMNMGKSAMAGVQKSVAAGQLIGAASGGGVRGKLIGAGASAAIAGEKAGRVVGSAAKSAAVSSGQKAVSKVRAFHNNMMNPGSGKS
ncbi:type IV secretion system protein [Chromobacterium haemolyticum]|uniref:Type IV secretion system protein n=1 Tax=Chromobacterium fluminis TaxID=3044269 RepID=A0ABX0KYD1_9NEIS|nr:type IV secretion system protein [Chromobacterium haemolyticum]NHR04534.1 type IV secretion system protein [Chromobacterium haemolyticum]